MIDSLGLRDLAVLVVHPHDHDGEVINRQLQRVGARATQQWPAPLSPPGPTDAVFCLVRTGMRPAVPPWLAQVQAAVIAVVEGDAPATLRSLGDGWPHGVLTRPLQPPAILTTLILAHRLFRYETRLHAKVAKLEDALRSVRKVEKAKAILMRERSWDERTAYDFLRSQAMNRRVPIQSIASVIIEATEMLA
jgi:AmiR/NasT family two-component response regulator